LRASARLRRALVLALNSADELGAGFETKEATSMIRKPAAPARLVLDPPPTNAGPDELLLCELIAAIEVKLLDDVQVAWRRDLVIILDFVGSHVGRKMVRRRDTLRVSKRMSERPPLFPGELAAAWVVAGDGDTCLFLRAAAVPIGELS
jgi:hypothetical protein